MMDLVFGQSFYRFLSISGCGEPHCEACFNKNYCTRCKAPYLAYRGDCVEQCPDGLYYATYIKDCQERGISSVVF